MILRRFRHDKCSSFFKDFCSTLRRLQDGEWLIASRHEMTREHHIAFVALISDDTLLLRRLYPEWNLETRLPNFRRGTLLYYCTQHVLFTKALSESFTNSK